MNAIAKMLRQIWLVVLALCGCAPLAREHVTGEGMVIVGSSGEHPEYAEAMFEEDYSRAEQIAAQIVADNPDDANGYIALAHPQSAQERFAEAAANYDKAIELDPQNSIALYSRGLVAQLLEQFETARHFYERALDFEPDSPDAHFGMAAACEGLGLHERVVKHASRFLELSADSAMASSARDMINIAKEEMAAER